MKLNKSAALVVALLTSIPLAFFVFTVTWLLTSGLREVAPSTSGAQSPDRVLHLIFTVQPGVMLFTLALLIFYVVHLFRSTEVPTDKKALWAVVLFLGHVLAMPVYWYYYLWRPASREPGVGPEPHADV